ncbi:hypothetical protein ACMHYO_01255 [Allopusillimonas ginsengisoli]|uniref:hypothetical protein n=1 Tax=Allopusillimonas ginsengisoli TaxID=453575 RepID=UPI0039C12CA9
MKNKLLRLSIVTTKGQASVNKRRVWLPSLLLSCVGLLCAATPPVIHAQVWAIEGLPWQFESSADKANKAGVLDIMERKKGGYYDSFRTTNYITNTTNIQRQYNCGVTANATGSMAESSQGSTVSSPVTTNTSGNYLTSTGNTSSTGTLESFGAGSAGASTDQSNTGAVSAGVRGSPSDASSGQISAGSGTSSQALNVSQSNTGSQTASLSGSTGCAFGSGGVALN